MDRSMQRLSRLTSHFALIVLSGCAGPSGDPHGPVVTASTESAETIDAEYGALEPRIVALDAFAGRRGPVTLRMTRHSVEGTRIVHELAVDGGKAVLSIDERADGGGVRRYTLTALQLVRYEPGRWAGNVEVEKDRFVAVDPVVARATAGVYLLAHPSCLSAPCSEVF
jgi:hypothetical protein